LLKKTLATRQCYKTSQPFKLISKTSFSMSKLWKQTIHITIFLKSYIDNSMILSACNLEKHARVSFSKSKKIRNVHCFGVFFALYLIFWHCISKTNCTALRQSELRNFFMYIINLRTKNAGTITLAILATFWLSVNSRDERCIDNDKHIVKNYGLSFNWKSTGSYLRADWKG
jgi:hypothetical protein